MAALESKYRPSSDYRPTEVVHRQGLREEEIQFIEQALKKRLSNSSLASSVSPKTSDPCLHSNPPQIKVKASGQSISITIPEGTKLPVVATIEAAGPIELETQMSNSQAAEVSEPGGNPGGYSRKRRSNRRATISEATSGTTTRDSEHQAIVSGFGLPFLVRPSKGRLTVSEASIPPPESSDFAAQGQVFIPPHEHPGGEGSDVLHVHPDEAVEREKDAAEAAELSTKASKDSDSQVQTEAEADPIVAEDDAPDTRREEPKIAAAFSSATRPASHLFTQSESAIEVIAGSCAKFGPPQPRSVPEIRIHRPSGTLMAASLGTEAMDSANVPSTATQSALDQNPAAVTAPLEITTDAVPVPANVPVDPSTVTNVEASAVPLEVPGSPSKGKVSKKKRIVHKARKLAMRKRLLAIIIGRDLANVVHPQLNTITNVAGGAPLSLDGPSDLIHGYARRTERRRDIHRRELDQKIASARIHAEAEEVHRCRICRGLTRTKHLRRYHRLQLKSERPDMSSFDRRATAMARVAAFKCKCTRRLLGVESEAAGKKTMGPQHPRAPAAAEPPLPGVDGALPQHG